MSLRHDPETIRAEQAEAALVRAAQVLTIDEVRDALRRVHRTALGGEGRLSFVIGMEPGSPCYIAHWVPSGNTRFEDCRSVGVGTERECLEALERYAAQYRRPLTHDEIGAMLGIEPDRSADLLRAAE